MSFKNVVRTN